jgi:O-antigen ligase
LWGALSLIWSVNRFNTVIWLIVLAMGGLAFMATARLRQVPDFRHWLVVGYLVSAVIAAGYGIWLYLTESFGRLTSSFYWPNPAAAYFIPAFILCLERATGSWRYRLAALLFGTVIMLTDSRGGILALVVGLLLFMAWQRPKKGYWITLVFTLILSFGLSTGVSQLRTHIFHQTGSVVPGQRLAQGDNDQSSSISDRINYLKSSLQIWEDNPVLGTGAGTFAAVHPRYQIRVISASNNAHNIIAQTLAELGVPGALLLLGLLLWLLIGGARGAAGEAELVALYCGLAALILHFCLDTDASYPALVVLAGALAGLTYRPATAIARNLYWPVLLATVAAALGISVFQSNVYALQASADQDAGYYNDAQSEYQWAHSWLVYNPDTITGEGINWYTLALVGHNPADARMALKRARQAERQDPDDAQHHLLAARALKYLKNYPAATKEYQTAIRLDPYNHPEYYDDLARLQLVEHQPAEAVKTATASLKQYSRMVINNRSADAALKPALGSLYLARAQAEHDLGRDDLAHQDAITAAPLLFGR